MQSNITNFIISCILLNFEEIIETEKQKIRKLMKDHKAEGGWTPELKIDWNVRIDLKSKSIEKVFLLDIPVKWNWGFALPQEFACLDLYEVPYLPINI
jgi:hypothetical protein